MRISKSAIALLISMILLSIFFANVVNLLSTDATVYKEPTKKPHLKIDDSNARLLWFLQITDIHISIFQDPLRITEFKEFCQYTIDAIKPSVVLASGDLTDAKTKDSIGSQQYEKEWQYYRNILEELHIREKTPWLDIRGNHDNFNVAGPDSMQNYFFNYSMQGKQNPRSYMYQLSKGKDLYSFIGVDACLEPGPRRPFNFIGLLDQPEIKELNHLINKSQQSGSNYTIWFGHFPTSCIVSTGNENVRDIIGKDPNGLVYVCGHLHKLGGLVPKMYTLQKSGFLELELGDWKDNRAYRLMVVDHGMFSFIDVKHREWPIALVTNPKNALFINTARENLDNIKSSTHIRVLAFSTSEIAFVKVKINDNNNWLDCYQIDGPLYVLKWNPKKYSSGLHTISVHVKDINGRENTYSQQFTMDDTRLTFDLLPRIALMTDASTIFRSMFVVMLVLSILPLVILKVVHKMVKDDKLSRPSIRRGCLNSWMRKFWILTTIDRIFWPIVLYPVYLSFGPWSAGYIVEDHFGVIFAWGIFVNGSYLPGSFTYAYGFIQLVTFQIPLTMILAHGVATRFRYKITQPERMPLCQLISLQIPFLIIFGLQVVMAYLFWLAYGTLAFVLGPLRTWSLVLAVILWYQAITLPDHCTRKAADIWNKKHSKAEDTSRSSVDLIKQ